MGDSKQNPAPGMLLIPVNTEIGPLLLDRQQNKRAIRGLHCKTSGIATVTDMYGNVIDDVPFTAGQVYPECISFVATGATAVLIALYGD